MTRVYAVGSEEDIEAVSRLDRQLSDGSCLGEEPSSVFCGTTLEEVREWINREERQSDTEHRGTYPRKPLMGRMRNETAYAVLDRELQVNTERIADCDVYMHRPGIQVYVGEQPSSSSYRR